jgi:Icc-related predicted phosphoesterase
MSCHFFYPQGTTIKGVKIWGSPWVPQHTTWQTAFNKTPLELKDHWKSKLPTGSGIDVLVTHSPARGHGDMGSGGTRLGCEYLLEAVDRLKPSYHVFGHIHSDYGVHVYADHECIGINASSVCDYYYLGGRAPVVFDMPVVSITDDLS